MLFMTMKQLNTFTFWRISWNIIKLVRNRAKYPNLLKLLMELAKISGIKDLMKLTPLTMMLSETLKGSSEAARLRLQSKLLEFIQKMSIVWLCLSTPITPKENNFQMMIAISWEICWERPDLQLSMQQVNLVLFRWFGWSSWNSQEVLRLDFASAVRRWS